MNQNLIKIHLKNAGINQIIVKDDGHGMKNDNLIKSLERFATSKISKQDFILRVLTKLLSCPFM